MDPIYCKVITPMFLAGTDKNNPELRAPSIRGALRWWFRAVAGSYVNLSELKRLEGCLFGDPGNEGASAIVVRVRSYNFTKEKKEMLPHKPNSRDRSKTYCIPEGTLFEVTLRESAYEPARGALTTAQAVFDLFATLGGLGRRVRRGFGAFQPISNDWQFEGAAAARQHVETKVKAAREAVKAFIDTHLQVVTPPSFGASAVAAYPILHPNVASIRVGGVTDWDSFIKALMPECSAIKLSSKDVLGSGRPRQASTLCVSVVQLHEEKLVPIYTQFYCKTQNRSRNRADFAELEELPDKVFPPTSLLPVSIT